MIGPPESVDAHVMTNGFHPYLRLSLFLLLSTGMHASLAFYDRMSGPDESGLTTAPVMVALLPVAEAASPVPALSAKPSVTPPPAPQPSRPLKKPRPRVVPKAVKPLPVAAPAKSPPEKAPQKQDPAVVAHAALPAEPSMKQVVCMEPQGVTPIGRPVMPETTTGTSEGEPVALPGPRPGPPGVTTVFGVRETIEAIPNYSSNPLPEYPLLARQKRWEGVVWLLVDVSKEGLVEDLRIEQSCGHGILDRAASHTVRRWQFTPARQAGQPASSQVRIPVRFQLEDS